MSKRRMRRRMRRSRSRSRSRSRKGYSLFAAATADVYIALEMALHVLARTASGSNKQRPHHLSSPLYRILLP